MKRGWVRPTNAFFKVGLLGLGSGGREGVDKIQNTCAQYSTLCRCSLKTKVQNGCGSSSIQHLLSAAPNTVQENEDTQIRKQSRPLF